MTSDYYRKWVDYLATHTIPVAEEKPEKSEPVESEPQPQVQKFSEEEEDTFLRKIGDECFH